MTPPNVWKLVHYPILGCTDVDPLQLVLGGDLLLYQLRGATGVTASRSARYQLRRVTRRFLEIMEAENRGPRLPAICAECEDELGLSRRGAREQRLHDIGAASRRSPNCPTDSPGDRHRGNRH
jgi:hypothetical protein